MKNLRKLSQLAIMAFMLFVLGVHDSLSQNQTLTDAGNLVSVTIPVYPLLPSGGREEGTVSASIFVNSSGKVDRVVTSGASDGLRRAAETAARTWEFKPSAHNTVVSFVFTLKEKKSDVCRPSVRFEPSIRVEICDERKKIITISDPPMVDLTKPKKQ